MVTTQTADNVLKSYYLSAVAEQLDKSVNPLLAAIRRTSSDISGKDVRKAVRYGVNGGVGAGTETGDLPEAQGNLYKQFVVPLKNLYGTIEISDKAIRASASGEGAFIDLVNDEMDGLVKSSAFNFGRMLFGDGKGTLGKISAGEGTSYTVDSVRNFAEGMVVDLTDAKGSSVAVKRTVTAVDRENKKITLSGDAVNVPAPDSDGVLPYTVSLQGSAGLEITGLGAIFSDGDLYGVAREGNPWMKPYVKSATGQISETVLQTAIDEVEMRSGGKINFIVCSQGVRRALVEALSAYRSLEPIVLEAGVKAVNFNGIPVVADRFCPEGTMYLINTEDFALHQLCDWQWLEGEDGKVLKQIAGKPVYTATLVKYAELMCYRPAGQAALVGIEEK